MSMLFEALERRVEGIDRYVAGRAVTAGALDEPGKLSGNEHVYGPSPAILAAVARATPRIGRYPNIGPVLRRLADHLGLEPESLLLTNGSDEVCVLISRLLRTDDAVVIGEPGYRMDEIVSLWAGAEVRRVPLRDGVHDVPAMIAAAAGACVLWLPNPHNPTGTALDGAQLRELLAGSPPSCIVVLDEAYREFMDADVLTDTISLLRDYPNLLVQRTFSKATSLAGLRVGFAAGHSRLIGVLDAFRPPFNVNQIALSAVDASLSDNKWVDYTVGLVREQRALLADSLERLGIGFWHSQTNFLTIATGPRTQRVHEVLAERGIVVRDGNDLGLPGHVRITIGAPPQMLVLRQALRNVFLEDNQ